MTGPLVSSTTITTSPPTSSSSSSLHKPVVKGNTAAKGSSKANKSPSSPSSLPNTEAKPAIAAAGHNLHKGPVALKPSVRKSAPPSHQPTSITTTNATTSNTFHNAKLATAQSPTDVMAMSAVMSPAPQPAGPPAVMSMTSKEWVIPPRPKPGRKPATDTPPTKRKAQNRAAQRAFRERRAARVGELEEELEKKAGEQMAKEQNYKDTIRDLELEVQNFRSRCLLLENMLERERKERLQAETQMETMRRQLDDRQMFRTGSLSGHPQLPAPQMMASSPNDMESRQSFSSTGTRDRHGSNTLPPLTNATTNSSNTQPYLPSENALGCGSCNASGRCACVDDVLDAGCGKCSLGTACQCLDEVADIMSQPQDRKRPASPGVNSPGHKRFRSAGLDIQESVDMNMAKFFSRRPTVVDDEQPSQYQVSQSMDGPTSLDAPFMKDDCGFCRDGTYCVCADTAMATPAPPPTDVLPPISAQISTPPPSEADVVSAPLIMEMTAEGAVKLPRRNPKAKRAAIAPAPAPASAPKSGCGPNGPGSCAQCRADPKSGLFCRLMAANFSKNGGSGGGCCGGKGADGGCCKTKSAPATVTTTTPTTTAGGPDNNTLAVTKSFTPTAAVREKITLPSLPSLGLSCAEAYQTLASHRNFDRAADDIGSWLPKLKVTPRPGENGRPLPPTGRMASIEVEAASIMSVLKDFDVRFGREA